MIDDEMYHEFRREIDGYAFPLLKKETEYIPIKCDGKTVGFLMVWDDYIEAAYVRKEYRRRGLMRDAVKKCVEEYGRPMHLHIVNGNTGAYAFWSSIFDLRLVEVGVIDTHYYIGG